MQLRAFVFAIAIGLSAAMAAGEAAAGKANVAAGKLCSSQKLAKPEAVVACLEKALQKAEADLAASVRGAREALAGGALKGADLSETSALFDAAQGHWLAFRNSECDAAERYDKALGAGGPQTRMACMINETVHRQNTMRGHFSSE